MKKLFFPLLFLLVFLGILTSSSVAAAGWYDLDWDYRREITISPVIPVADYQIKLELTTVDMGSPYANVNADGSDIRFTTTNGTTSQDYWIESWNSTGTSIVWVEVKDLGADTIYMYYGNAVAVSESNGLATFELFDDFNDGFIDANIWDVIGGSPTESGGIIEFYNAYEAIRSDTVFNGNYMMMGDVSMNKVVSANALWGWTDVSSGSYGSFYYSFADNDFRHYYGESSWQFTDLAVNDGGYHNIKLGMTASQHKLWYDGTLKSSPTSSLPTGDQKILLYSGGDAYLRVDWIAVLKYALTEPNANIGEESELVAPSVSTNIANSVYRFSAQLNGSLTDLGSAASVDVWFEWGTTTAYGNTTASTVKSATGTFSAQISELFASTTYHFKAAAEIAPGVGVSYGGDMSFTTLANNYPSVDSVWISTDNEDICKIEGTETICKSGEIITFNSIASDSEGDDLFLYICRDEVCTNCEPGDDSGCWAHSLVGSASNPLATYDSSINGPCEYAPGQEYWAKICDEHDYSSGIIKEFVCGDLLDYAGQDYSTVLIGTQCWMAENLNMGTMVAGTNFQTDNGIIEKHCYSDNTTNCDSDGGLYQWNEAMQYFIVPGVQGICPAGWHVPTHDELTTLERAVCISGTCETDFPYDTITLGPRGNTEGNALRQGGSSGFEALLAGSSVPFWDRGTFGYFWTSSLWDPSMAFYRKLFTNPTGWIFRANQGLAAGYSVCCLKD